MMLNENLDTSFVAMMGGKKAVETACGKAWNSFRYWQMQGHPSVDKPLPCAGMLRRHFSARTHCAGLLRSHWGIRKHCASVLRSHLGAREHCAGVLRSHLGSVLRTSEKHSRMLLGVLGFSGTLQHFTLFHFTLRMDILRYTLVYIYIYIYIPQTKTAVKVGVLTRSL